MVAPYRVDFFNNLALHFDMLMCIDRKVVYGGLFQNVEKDYGFQYNNFLSTKGFFSTYSYVRNKIIEWEPDIVMVSECGLVSLVVVILKVFRMKKFSIISIIDDNYNTIVEGTHVSKKHEIAEKILIPRFSNIINVEPKISSYFQERYGKGFFFPIIRDENIYRKQLCNALPISQSFLTKYNLHGQQIVLYVGRFVAVKNVTTLIKAVNLLDDKNVKLVLVGAGPEESKYRQMLEVENIVFTGALSGLDLYAWYILADVLVLPSTLEPFGAVVNEALMAGCKCVVSERAGSSCLIRDGQNGFITNPIDEREISRYIRMILDVSENKCIEKLRHNLMPYTFKERFDDMLKILL